MFRKNNDHLQNNLFNSLHGMDSRLAEKLQTSWAALFYEHVFCQIDENVFAPLYAGNHGRPNFPVNILMAVDLIKHLKEYTDEVLLDEYAFNYQISYALGLRTLGERYFSPRTLYEFRARCYNYSIENPEKADLIFAQFEKITEQFIQLAGLNKDEGRMDSTQIMSNIRLGGRLSLAYDVLVNGVKSLPEVLLTEPLKVFLKANYKTEYIYRLKNKDILSRIQMLLNHCGELLQITAAYSELQEKPEVQLVRRFLEEQAEFHAPDNQWTVKGNREISAQSLQSAYDSDATYRNKGGKKHVGYVLNLTETCADENPIQLVTHYQIAPNTKSDVEMLNEALPVLSEELGVKDLYADGGYYSADTMEKAQSRGITLHYTDMTGRKATGGKISLSAFVIENKEKILRCPAGHSPLRSDFNPKSGILSAHFNLDRCQGCPHKENCRVKFQKRDTVLYVNQKALNTEENRLKIINRVVRQEATSKRAAIEGTNSVLKRAHHADKLKVRGIVKCQMVMGSKLLAHNFRQIVRFFKGAIRKKAQQIRNLNQGIAVAVC